MFLRDLNERRFHVALPTTLVAIVILLTGLSTFSRADSQWPSAAIRDAEAQTHTLAAMANRYERATASEQASLLGQMLSAADDRRELLAGLIEDSPGAILRVALPERVRSQMPPAVQALLEEEVEVQGKLEVVIEHSEGSSRTLHFIRDDRQSLHPVRFATSPTRLDGASRVSIHGIRLGARSAGAAGDGSNTAIVPFAGDAGLQYLAGDGSGSGSQSGGVIGEVVNPLGEQRTLVMLVNFQDTADQTPFTITQAHNAIFGTVDAFFNEASYGKTWLAGDVHGWYTLPIASTCNTNDISNAADVAVAASGVDLAAYGRLIYVMQGSASCFWSGASNMWVYPSRGWINGNLDSQVIAHELGHGFGLQHSNFLDCGDQVMGTNCITARDDKFDAMGAAPDAGHFNVFQKERLGWMEPGQIITASVDGSHTLAPVEIDGGTKAIKVLKEQDPAGQGATWFYLEFRQALGFDSFIAGNENVLNGVLVRTGSDFDSASSLLLDTTPGSSIHSFQDRNDPALVSGESFTDPESGITISTNSADSSGAIVSIGVAQPACLRGSPVVSTSPSQSQWVAPGTPVVYDIIVANADSTVCPDATFDLAQTAPAGWVAALASDVVIVAPGGSAATTLTVISPTDAVDGFYDIGVSAANSSAPAYTSSGSAVYAVSTADDNQAPAAADDDAATSIDTPVTVDVLANDTDPDGDTLSITGVAAAAHGTVSVNANRTVTYTPAHRFKGTDSFSYTVSDGLNFAVAIATVSVRKNGGGGGGGEGGGGKGGGNGKGKNR